MFNSSHFNKIRPSTVLTEDSALANKLFFSNAHDCMGESLAVYVRACTHQEAAERMIEFWRTEEVIEDLNDIEEDVIDVYEVPCIEGDAGVLIWDDFDRVTVPKDGLV